MEMVAKNKALPLIRNDVHGIDVFKTPQRKVGFVSASASGSVAKNAGTFAEAFRRFYEARDRVPAKVELACEIYCASFFDKGSRSRFITLITAIEALIERPKRSAALRQRVKELIEAVKLSDLDADEREALVKGLGNLKVQSIGEAGRQLAELRLAEQDYEGKSASQFFSHCYSIRSKLVHMGKSPLSSVELSHLTNICSRFVRDLLMAEINLVDRR